MKISNREMHQVIRDAFENYGYVDLDTTEPKNVALLSFMKTHFITRRQLQSSPMGEEYRYIGIRVWLLKMTKKFWADDLEEYFKNELRYFIKV